MSEWPFQTSPILVCWLPWSTKFWSSLRYPVGLSLFDTTLLWLWSAELEYLTFMARISDSKTDNLQSSSSWCRSFPMYLGRTNDKQQWKLLTYVKTKRNETKAWFTVQVGIFAIREMVGLQLPGSAWGSPNYCSYHF